MSDDREKLTDSNNQFVHRMIPTVTAVGLTLGAGACGGSDGSKGPSTDDLRNFCSDLRSCEGEENFDYSSIDECVSEFENEIRYYTDLARDQAGQACVDATLEVFDCLVDEAVCDMGEFGYTDYACEETYAAYYDTCYDDLSDSM